MDCPVQSQDEQLALEIEQARGGDHEAFERLMAMHLDFLSQEINKLVPHSHLEDVAQEVLLRVFLGLPKYREQGAFRWWLKRIVSRACLDFWRRERRRELIARMAGERQERDAAARLPQAGTNADIHRFLARLSADDRLVFILAFLEDRPHREISELLGISVAAVKVRSFRLKRKMKEWYEI